MVTNFGIYRIIGGKILLSSWSYSNIVLVLFLSQMKSCLILIFSNIVICYSVFYCLTEIVEIGFLGVIFLLDTTNNLMSIITCSCIPCNIPNNALNQFLPLY